MINKYFTQRTSVRSFSSKNVPEEIIEAIVSAAAKAPTCGNMQLYTIIETRKTDLKEKLAEQHFNQPAAATAPVILTICADFNRFSQWCEISDAAPGYNNFHSFIVALTDAVIMAQQITTIAEMEGFGTCYLGTVNYNAENISKLLELPDLVVPVASLAIGYIEKESEPTERLPLNAILHKEAYRHDSEEEIKALFKEKEDFPANKEFVQINKKPNLAHVFTEIRYPKEMNEAVSSSFLELLKKKGFA